MEELLGLAYWQGWKVHDWDRISDFSHHRAARAQLGRRRVSVDVTNKGLFSAVEQS